MARILVVDDDELTRRTLRLFLERSGHRVTEAGDGHIATKLYREDPADVLIIDIYMPEKEGLETILDLRTEFHDMKIIAISGGGGAFQLDPLRTAELLGAARTLIKPIDMNELLAAVDEVLRD